jgi:hypothetical protein
VKASDGPTDFVGRRRRLFVVRCGVGVVRKFSLAVLAVPGVAKAGMADSLDVLAVIGKDDFRWIGFAHTYDEAEAVIRKHGKPGTYFVHSQTTGRRTFYKAESGSEIVQLTGPPLEVFS